MSETPTDRERFVPALLNLIYNRVASTGTATYGRAFDLGLMDYRVLDVLANDPDIAARRIVEVTGIDKGAVSRALKHLDARGLLAAAAPQNRRRLLYALSVEGAALHAEATILAGERKRRSLDGISPDDQAHLFAVLQVILGNLDKLKALADRQKPA